MKPILLGAFVYLVVVALLARRRLHELHPARFFLDTWREVDRDAHAWRQDRIARGLSPVDARPFWVFLSLAVVLTIQEYYGDRGTFDRLRHVGLVFEWANVRDAAHPHRWVVFGPPQVLSIPRYDELLGLAWWAFMRAGPYLVAPAVFLLAWRESPMRHGLRIRGFLDHAWIYALFFGIVLIAVVIVSATPEFANYYPFYRLSNRSWKDFLLWESMYAFQFFALEFYFRGFLVFGAVRSMGTGAILAMVVPYCMVHFGKPMAETFGAILAGTVLATLALKTRSIWSGFLIHVTVAVSMDVMALLQTRGLPGGFKLG